MFWKEVNVQDNHSTYRLIFQGMQNPSKLTKDIYMWLRKICVLLQVPYGLVFLKVWFRDHLFQNHLILGT